MLFNQLKYPVKLYKYAYLYICYKLNFKKLPFTPQNIDIEPINQCNFRCSHCQVTYWDKPKATINSEKLVQIINQFKDVIKIKLQGMGEPLLNPELSSMLKLVEEQGYIMTMTSNGSLLSSKRIAELAQLNNTYINFSIDAASAEVFESIRTGSNFQKVCENIKNFTDTLDEKSNSPRYLAWMLVTYKNLTEVEDVVRLVKELGLKHLTLQTFFSDWGKEHFKQTVSEQKLDITSEQLKEKLHRAKKVADELGINLRIYYGDYLSKNKKCTAPWLSTYITADGDITPCNKLSDADLINFGNVFEQDFQSIWNSAQYQAFREQHINFEIPELCRQCYLDC